MLIIGATRHDLDNALAKANEKFDNNLLFNNITGCGKTRDGQPKFKVTITVISSRGSGAKLGAPQRDTRKQRHIKSACWHAHGTFFDALPSHCTIVTGAMVTGGATTHPGAPWRDFNIGTQLRPFFYSEACECRR